MKAEYPHVVLAWDAKDVVGGGPSSNGYSSDLRGLSRAPEVLSNCCIASCAIEKSARGKEDSFIMRVCNHEDQFGAPSYKYFWKALFQDGEEGLKAHRE